MAKGESCADWEKTERISPQTDKVLQRLIEFSANGRHCYFFEFVCCDQGREFLNFCLRLFTRTVVFE